jgi:membrane-associated protein
VTLEAFNPLNAESYINLFGAWAVVGVCLITFAETGLLIGFFFPGDSLLFIAGFLTLPNATHHLSLVPLLVFVPICAILGAQLGHFLGARFGRPLFEKPDSRLFKREYVDKAEEVFYKYGASKAIILARFIPVVRTFLNPVAGVLEVSAKQFFVYNLIGGLVWTEGVLVAGHLVGSTIPASKVDTYIIPVTLLIVLLSVIPVIAEIRKARKAGGTGAAAAQDDSPQAGVSTAGARHRK